MDATKQWAITAWLRIQEPRIVSILQLIVYLAAIGAGISAVLDPPPQIQGAVGPGLTILWVAMILGGGLLGAVGVLPGIWWVERPAAILCFGATVIYGYTLIHLHAGREDPALQILMVTIAATYFLMRWFRIRRYAYDPEK